ncbi:MAG: type IV pilus twitching motility protein PilT [Verrucomicrobiae bacterium]|nr:type IV pilus twitching motility protein PilT [Verrucomicrobiae bacterium]
MAEIDRIFKIMLEHKASDLHLHEGQPPKARVHGDIEPIADEVLTHESITGMLQEIAGDRWQKFADCGDLDFAYQMDENSRFRANYFKQVHGSGAVFRIIPTKILTLEQLNVPPIIREFGKLRSGLVLVTGPTGSGKSTTLAALIDFINTNMSKHIVTIEEPIEFVHKNKKSVITQREVHVDTPSFKSGLKAAMREDADVILVGEMRDLETISLALTAAETGMLVFGTLHTNNAQKTIDRIIDVFPPSQQPQVRTMLASSLKGVVAQLLMKRADGKGRLAVNEILVCNTATASIIREGKTVKLRDVIAGGTGEGMQLMDDAIMKYLKENAVSPMEAYMKAIEKPRFAPLLPADAALGN